jgi:sulfur-carrier protein
MVYKYQYACGISRDGKRRLSMAKVKVTLFGPLMDCAGAKKEMEAEASDVETLDQNFRQLFPAFHKHQYRIAVNRKIVKENTELTEGDEIAFLPPFAGG